MIWKRIHFVFSGLLTVVFILYLCCLAYVLFLGRVLPSVFHWVLIGTIIPHALVSICLFLFSKNGISFAGYWRYSLGTVLQRLSACCIALLLHDHMELWLSQNPQTSLIPGEILFLGAVCLHISLSLPKFFLSIGFCPNKWAYQLTQYVSYFLAGGLFLVSFFALLLWGKGR